MFSYYVRAKKLVRLYILFGATRPDHVMSGRIVPGRVVPDTRPDWSQYSDRSK